jgi:UDP-N-acetylmuramoyl-tripeptide--D-alanyl-D-alanine ligase
MFDKSLLEKVLMKSGIKKRFSPGLIASATIDSREAVENSIFFAFRGENNDGHDYIEMLLEKEVYCVGEKGEYDNPKFIKVESVLSFLQDLAKERRKYFAGKVISLTGSSGKTTTRELLAAMLRLSGKTVHTSHANFNNHIGLPLVILNLPLNIDYMVLEMGMNHSGEIKTLTGIASPDISFITNIGTAHIGNFESQEDLANAKLEIFEYSSGSLVADIDDKYIKNWVDKNKDRKIHTYQKSKFYTVVENFNNQPGYMIENLMTAVEVIKSVSNKIPDLENVIKKSNLPSMRGEIRKCGKREFVLDCYNANPDSMHKSIDEFYKKCVAEKEEKIYLILGSMFELGVFSKKMHQELVKFLKTLTLLKRTFLIGCEFDKIKSDFLNEKNMIFLGDIADIVPFMPDEGKFLMKGSRGNRLEKLFEVLECRGGLK